MAKICKIPTEQELAEAINDALNNADHLDAFIFGTSSSGFKNLDDVKDQIGFRLYYQTIFGLSFISDHAPIQGEAVAEFDVIIRRVK